MTQVPAPKNHDDEESRRRRRERWSIAVAAVLFATLAIFQARTPQLNYSPTSGVTFFLLINFNLILLLLLIFLVMRNLGKLFFERRRGVFGSRLRSRLVIAFLVLTILPTSMLYFVAQGFLHETLDHWFSRRIEKSMASAVDISETFYRKLGDDGLRQARLLEKRIALEGLLDLAQKYRLEEVLDTTRRDWNLAAIEILVEGETVHAVIDVERRDKRPPVRIEDVAPVLSSGEAAIRTEPTVAGEIVRAIVPIRDQNGGLVGAIAIDSFVPSALSRAALNTVTAYQEYRQLKVLERPVRSGYTVSFWLITLVVIFGGTWFGLRIARDIADPIRRLGQGMIEVAKGNWNYRAEIAGDEEVASLMASFNQMTSDLNASHSALEERHRYIESILANIAAGVVSIEPGGTVATLNPAAGEMLGLRPEAVQGRPWREGFADVSLRPVAKLVERVLERGEAVAESQIKLTRGRTEVTAWVTATMLSDEGGAPRSVMLFLEDVTHLQRVERMEAWREVARRIAHEIKNPLTPIQLSAQRLQKRYGETLQGEDAALLNECTTTIIGQVDQLKKLVNEFAQFARLPTLELAPHDINRVIEDALVLFREGHRGIKFDFRPDSTVPTVTIDRNAITRVVINMLDNAVAACVGVGTVDPRIELITLHDPGAAVVRLEIADNGPGMPPAVKARAFEPYFSTKKDGSGLGLAIVSAIVADHHGYIRLYDNRPTGTRIVIELPVRSAMAQPAAEARA